MEVQSENKRTPNFSSFEESTLIALMSKYKSILECKRTDSENSRQKKNVWLQLTKEFNSINVGTQRTTDVLINKYRNIKKRVKKKFADEKCYAQGTGGGPHKKIKIDEIDMEVKDILGTQITGLRSEFDDYRMILIVEESENTSNAKSEVPEKFSSPSTSNTNWMSYNSKEKPLNAKGVRVQSTIGQEIRIDISSINETDGITKAPDRNSPKSVEPQTSKCTDWSSYTPATLRTPKTKCLKTVGGQRNKLSNRLTLWAEAKSETDSLQAKIMREKHELDMQQQIEKYELDMQHKREKHSTEMRFAEEEHQLKMDILKKQLNN